MNSIPYPVGYFDPDPDVARAQCVTCGEYFEPGEIDEVEAVPCLEYGEIWQGICNDCQLDGGDNGVEPVCAEKPRPYVLGDDEELEF